MEERASSGISKWPICTVSKTNELTLGYGDMALRLSPVQPASNLVEQHDTFPYIFTWPVDLDIKTGPAEHPTCKGI
jgi:hypothetical protein